MLLYYCLFHAVELYWSVYLLLLLLCLLANKAVFSELIVWPVLSIGSSLGRIMKLSYCGVLNLYLCTKATKDSIIPVKPGVECPPRQDLPMSAFCFLSAVMQFNSATNRLNCTVPLCRDDKCTSLFRPFHWTLPQKRCLKHQNPHFAVKRQGITFHPLFYELSCAKKCIRKKKVKTDKQNVSPLTGQT